MDELGQTNAADSEEHPQRRPERSHHRERLAAGLNSPARFLNRLVHELLFHEIHVTVTPASPWPLVRGPKNPTVTTTIAILQAIKPNAPKEPNRRKSNAIRKLETTVDRR